MVVALLAALLFLPSLQAQPTVQGAPGLRDLTAESCAGCHAEIYQQWKGSMHANSTPLRDPIHGAFYRHVIGDPQQEGVRTKMGTYPVCLKCHAPNAAQAGATKVDAKPSYADGITCTVCHTMKEYKGIHGSEGRMQLGGSAYEFTDVLQGPSGKTFSSVPPPPMPPGVETTLPSFHPYPMEGNTRLLRTSDACLGCHDQRNNFHGVPLCMTGAEFRQAETFNCQQCHMPVVNGIADHSMAGGHVQSMLERSVLMTLDTAREGDEIQATVTLKNMLPHNTPTGAPFRNMYLKVTAFDGAGQPLWRSSQSHPIKDDPKAAFRLILVDEEGKPTAPPMAKGIGDDTRLKPHEERTLTYAIPARGVKLVRAQMYYDLLLPPIKQKFPEIPEELKRPKLIAVADQRF
jgi:nitrate/TMAO reductase-like tetraheme cytochrome c subunit